MNVFNFQLNQYNIRCTSFLNLNFAVDFCTFSGKRFHNEISRANGLFRYFLYVLLYFFNLILFLPRKLICGRACSSSSAFLLSLYITDNRCSSCLDAIGCTLYISDSCSTDRPQCCLLSIVLTARSCSLPSLDISFIGPLFIMK